MLDTDGDGIPNALDTDSDGDGLLDQNERGDGDDDGVVDYLDNVCMHLGFLFVCLFVCLFICLFVCLFVHNSSCSSLPRYSFVFSSLPSTSHFPVFVCFILFVCCNLVPSICRLLHLTATRQT